MRGLLWMAPLLALAACGGDKAEAPAEPVKPATLPAGEWEVSSLVERLRSTDNSTPAVALKQGEASTHRACVAADGTPAPELWLAKGDACTASSVYIKDGRINGSWTCKRPGKPGQVMPAVDGKYDADSFEVVVTTGTYLGGAGNYEMTQKMTGKRLGDCPAAGAAEAENAS